MASPAARPPYRLGRAGGAVLACVLLVLGLAVSFGTARAMEDAQRRQAGQRMDHHLETVRAAVSGEVHRRVELLGDLAAAVGAQRDPTARDFDALTFRLAFRALPGATGVAYAVPVADARVQDAQRAWRRRGAADLSLRPAGAGEHRFVVLDRSLEPPSPALGSDLAAAAEPSEAMGAARRTGRVTAGRPYVLLRDRGLPADRRQTSFVLVAPVHGAGEAPDAGLLRGWLVMGVRGGDFADGALRRLTHGMVQVTISDVSAPGPARPAATVRNGEPLAGSPELRRAATVEAAGRAWRVELTPTAAFAAASGAGPHPVLLGGGTALSVLTAGLVLALTASRERALSRMEHTAEALRADLARHRLAEARLRERGAELERFASVAAYDLKSPLTVITGYTELVEDQLGPGADPRIRGWLQRVRQSTGRMRRLIDDLLSYSSAGDVPLEPAEVDLEQLVAAVVMERTAHLAHDRPHVGFGRLPAVTADPALLRQVMDHLIANAVKYVRHGATAQVDVSAERRGEAWRVTVSDRGIGIAPEQRESVFAAFGRARGSEGYPGTGLGLAICRRIVERHGGAIHAEENPGGGTRVVFTLPVVPEASPPGAAAEDGTGGTDLSGTVPGGR
ncbi:ATP-binding protein [Planomonospora corallina]|uniref:Sensor-like histidine kinase SenX3 n=1 Tax=Planomonospora corallina TaxID=1806052 RepID=A0ABV8I469_9ACTN